MPLLTGVDRRNLEFETTISTCEAKDLATWKVSMPACLSNISSKQHVTIVPDHQKMIFESAFQHPCSKVIGERELAKPILDFFHHNFNGDQNRRGWYLQQFLKLEAVRQYSQHGDVLIWDSDTIPLRKLSFRNGNQFFAYRGKDWHLPYFMAIERAFSMQKKDGLSFIAQSFPVKRDWARRFFNYLEVGEKTWFENLAHSIDFRLPSGFSEYETLGVFVQNEFPGELGDQTQATNWDLLTVYRRRLHAKKVRSLVKSADVEHQPVIHFRAIESRAKSKLSILLEGLANSLTYFFSTKELKPVIERIVKKNTPVLVQVGAGDGVMHDPLVELIEKDYFSHCTLIEPEKASFRRLSDRYENRDDIRLVEQLIGSPSNKTLYAFPSHILELMDGDGPNNLWAAGATSRYKSTLVYWVYRNSWRGLNYQQAMEEFIDSIYEFEAEAANINNFMTKPDKTLLVLDVQGMEAEIIEGIQSANLPRWVIAETDYPGNGIHGLMASRGYKLVHKGSDSIFELGRT